MTIFTGLTSGPADPSAPSTERLRRAVAGRAAAAPGAVHQVDAGDPPLATDDLEAAFQATGAAHITAYGAVPGDRAAGDPRPQIQRSLRTGHSGRPGHRPGRRHGRSVATGRRVLRLYRRRQHPRRRGTLTRSRHGAVSPAVLRRFRPDDPRHQPHRHGPRTSTASRTLVTARAEATGAGRRMKRLPGRATPPASSHGVRRSGRSPEYPSKYGRSVPSSPSGT
jgi:hypothetical protein